MNNYFLSGGGIISERVGAIDWQNHPLGIPTAWPESLKSSFNLCLNSPFPMLIFFNDRYTDFLEQPYDAIGQPASIIWKDIWDRIGPMLEGVKANGKAILLEDQLFYLPKDKFKNEHYFTFSYSPIWAEEGII